MTDKEMMRAHLLDVAYDQCREAEQALVRAKQHWQEVKDLKEPT